MVGSRSCHPVHLWWRAWIGFQQRNGISAKNPATDPTTSFNRRVRKSVPWPHSCRSANHCRNAPDSIAWPAAQATIGSRVASHHPTQVETAAHPANAKPIASVGRRSETGGGAFFSAPGLMSSI